VWSVCSVVKKNGIAAQPEDHLPNLIGVKDWAKRLNDSAESFNLPCLDDTIGDYGTRSTNISSTR